MFRLEAPYPVLASTILLPNPEIGNNKGLSSRVNIIQMMDGSDRSYVRSASDEKLHRWDFLLAHDKMEELADFMTRYAADTMRATWRERVIIGKPTLNPIEFQGEGHAGGWPGDEAYVVTMEMREE